MAGRPCGMRSDERRKNLADGGPVAGRVFGQAFQRVDASDADVDFIVAELVNRVGKTVRYQGRVAADSLWKDGQLRWISGVKS